MCSCNRMIIEIFGIVCENVPKLAILKISFPKREDSLIVMLNAVFFICTGPTKDPLNTSTYKFSIQDFVGPTNLQIH